jgi:protein-S-isoprenylcysteine O-methyltransferase Ste14
MITDDPYLIVRAAALEIPIVLTAVAWVLRRPDRRALAGALLAFAWNLPALLALHLAAARFGWWTFDADGGLLLGMPVDLWLAWALLWGAAPAIALPSSNLITVSLVALAIDLLAMPAATPVVRLAPNWLIGEFAGIALCLMPAQLLARWTASDRHLPARALMQAIVFSGIVGFLVPAIAIDASRTAWINPLTRPTWILSLIVQVLAVPALFGMSAVQEFVTRGGGTPVPYDPPLRLVRTGVYAYVANPMQLSAVVLLLLMGIALGNIWVASAGLMAHLYSTGIAGWDEDGDLVARFGADWLVYRRHVRKWIPRVRPWYHDDHPVATLYVSAECGMCRQVALWFRRHDARGLSVVPAEEHHTGALMRITYESADRSYTASGTSAIARAFEHIHLAWAMLGFVMRLPIVSPAVQLIADASGAQPRRVRSWRTGERRTS